MNRLTKRNSKGVAYMIIADSLPKRDQELEGSKPILEGLYAMFQKLAAYEDTDMIPEDIKNMEKNYIELQNRFTKAMIELEGYKDLEEQGLLIKLPPITKEDTLYWIWGDKIMPVKLEEIDTGVTYKMTTKEDRTFTKINGGKFTYEKGNVRFFYSDDFGKTVFLTREEAEKALEEMNENK